MKKEENPSSEFNKFKEFVRKVVSVPKSEIDSIKEEELKEKKKAPKKRPAKSKT
ncbi:hypothetical protein [Tunturiibacter gelidiferens]|uniref:hypothetical protein n=1 Tax=Tunturiibacter gelidiferens TaxID=3069689 RepID=UPI003D9B5FB9